MSTTATHQARKGTITGAATGFLVAAVAVGTAAVWAIGSDGSGTSTPPRAPAVVDTHVVKRPCFNAPIGGMAEEGGVPTCTVVVPR
jgi:hypothetical protein